MGYRKAQEIRIASNCKLESGLHEIAFVIRGYIYFYECDSIIADKILSMIVYSPWKAHNYLKKYGKLKRKRTRA